VIGTLLHNFFSGRIDGYGFAYPVDAQEFLVALGPILTAVLSLQIPVVTLALLAVCTKALDVAFGSLTATLSGQIPLLPCAPAFNTLKTIAAHDGGFPMYRLARFADVGAPHADPQEDENGKGQQDRGSTHGTLGRSRAFGNTSVVNALAGGIGPLWRIKINYEGNEVKPGRVMQIRFLARVLARGLFESARQAGMVSGKLLALPLPLSGGQGGELIANA